MTCLGDAVRAQREEDVARLLRHPRVKVNKKDNEGYTALHLAARLGNARIIKLLLTAKAGVNVRRRKKQKRPSIYEGPTALHYAAQGGHIGATELLIQAGADVNAIGYSSEFGDDWQFNTFPLTLAVKGHHQETAVKLLIAGANATEFYDYETLIICAAAADGQYEVVKAALEAGCNVDAGALETDNQRTPLSHAAENGHLEVVDLLVQHGAEIDARDFRNWTPLHRAAADGQESVFDYLLEHQADPLAMCISFQTYEIPISNTTILHLAALGDHLGIANKAIQLGVSIIAEREDGCTALHCSAHSGGEFKVLRMLLGLQLFDVDLVYDNYLCRWLRIAGELMYDVTPLMIACDESYGAIAALLYSGAGVNCINSIGCTPLHFLSAVGIYKLWGNGGMTEDEALLDRNKQQREHGKAMKILLEAGAGVDAKNSQGVTPLHLACSVRNPVGIRALVENYANVDAKIDSTYREREGFTPAHCLTDEVQDHEYFLPSLVELKAGGAQFNAQDLHGNAPLHYLLWTHLDTSNLLPRYRPIDEFVLERDQRFQMRARSVQGYIEAGGDACVRNFKGQTPLMYLLQMLTSKGVFRHGHTNRNIKAISSLIVVLVAAGDFCWEAIPDQCPGLEAALAPIWWKWPEQLPELFRRLESGTKLRIRAILRIMHRRKLPEELRARLLGETMGSPLRLLQYYSKDLK